MNFDSLELIDAFALVFGIITVVQVVTAIYILSANRRATEFQQSLNRHTFGLLRKIEGLVARKQERILQEYDAMLDQLSVRVPNAIAQDAARELYETERQILTRLAELEPDLNGDDVAIKKMNELIKCMEKLEVTMISSATEVVQGVLKENRKALLEKDKGDTETIAA